MGTGKLNAGGNPAMDQHPIPPGGVEILPVSKLRPDGPPGLYANFTFFYKPLMLRVRLSLVDAIHLQGNRYVMGVEIKAAGDLK